VTVRKGRLAEYAPFSHWHYLGAGRPGPVTDVFVAEFARRPIAIAVFCAPHLFLGPRNLLLPRFSSNRVAELGAGALNANLRLLSRIVVEPAFRGMGVAAKLLREALPALGVRYVECLAEMGEFSGFLVRAGFERKGQVKPSREARSLIKTLERLGLRERELADPALRREIMARLNSRTRARLLRQLAGLCRSRVQTGKGSLRGRACSAGEEVLQRALWRLRCRPEYFLWERP
jgi:GNAT superfamily N-acetyltransferase